MTMSFACVPELADQLAEAVKVGVMFGAVIGVVAFVATEKFIDLLTLHVPRWIRAWRRARA